MNITASKRTTPPFSSRSQYNPNPFPINTIARFNRNANRQEEHLLSISPWCNQELPQRRQKNKIAGTQRPQNSIKRSGTGARMNTVGSGCRDHLTVGGNSGRCLTQSKGDTIQNKNPLMGNFIGQEEEEEPQLRVNTIQLRQNAPENRKYHSEQVCERKMSMSRFRSGLGTTAPTSRNHQSENKSKSHKKLIGSTGSAQQQRKNYIDVEQTKVLIEKKLTDTGITVNQASSHYHKKWRQGVCTNKQDENLNRCCSLLFFMQPRQKNNIMTREKNIMKIRNLMSAKRRVKTDGLQC